MYNQKLIVFIFICFIASLNLTAQNLGESDACGLNLDVLKEQLSETTALEDQSALEFLKECRIDYQAELVDIDIQIDSISSVRVKDDEEKEKVKLLKENIKNRQKALKKRIKLNDEKIQLVETSIQDKNQEKLEVMGKEKNIGLKDAPKQAKEERPKKVSLGTEARLMLGDNAGISIPCKFEDVKNCQLVQEFLLSFVPKDYTSKAEMLRVSATVIKKNEFLFLSVQMILDELISDSYGNISEGNSIEMHMLNNDVVYLSLFSTSEAKPYLNETNIYILQCPITKKDQRILSTEYLDFLRVKWNDGYEDYPIYNIDLIKRQITCLQNCMK